MNNIEEIKIQNQFDCFIKMYSYIANAILENGGKRGERAVRDALQKYGEDRGKKLREAHLEKGVKTNLRAFRHSGNCCGEDPRFYRTILKDSGQVQIWEVYSCPLEHMWRNLNCGKAGAFYCEECVHAMVKAYTCGKGQANLSDLMTCERDTYCRFSLYYRPANLDERQRDESFGNSCKEGMEKEADETDMLPDYSINENFIKLYYYLLGCAKELLGQEGISSVALGLKSLKKDIAETLKKESDNVDHPLDLDFMKDYFPLELTEQEDLWDQYSGNDAERLLRVNLIAPLKKDLNLLG